MTKRAVEATGPVLSRYGFAERDVAHRDPLWVATREDDRAAFDEVRADLDAAVTSDAYGFVRPRRVEEFVAATWAQVWEDRRRYRGDEQPLDWVHEIMCDRAAVLAPAVGPGNDTSVDELACLNDPADLEAFLVADLVDDILDCLHPCHALILRRRWALGPDWPMITRELAYRNERQTKKAYRHAKNRFDALFTVVAAPNDTEWMKKGEPPPSRRTR